MDHVSICEGKLKAHVLGDITPKGIYGRGVIDALACLLKIEVLDETGLLQTDPIMISSPVSLSQKDVRMVQLAKSTICAGLYTLLGTSGSHAPMLWC